MMNVLPVTRQRAVAAATFGVVALMSAVPALAASETWSATPTDSLWTNGLNWTSGNVPGDATTTTNTDTAFFGATTNGAVTVDTNRNLQSLSFNGGGGSTIISAYTLSGGPLILTSAGQLRAFNNATNNVTVSAPITVAGENATYTFESSLPGTSRLVTLSGAIVGNSTGTNVTTLTFTGTSGALNNISGTVSDGAGGGKVAVVKNGTGIWSFSAAQTYTGGTLVTAGQLRTNNSGNTNALFGTGTITLQNNASLRTGSTTATTVNNAMAIGTGGGTISVRGAVTFSPPTLTGSDVLTFTTEQPTNTITPTTFGAFTGTVNATNTAGTPTGGTIIRLASAFDNATLANVTVNLNANTSLNRQNGTNQANNAANTATVGGLSGTGGFFGGSAAGSGNFTYNIGNTNQDTAYAGVIGNGGSITSIGKVGTGTLTLSGANSYTGGTTINAGKLNINGINALGGANYGLFATNPALRATGGTLQYASTLTSSGDITTNPGSATAALVTVAGPFTIDTNGNAVTYANSIGNNGTGSLTKAGSGTLLLSAASTYTGSTTVAAGTLQTAPAATTALLANASGTNVAGGSLVLEYTGSSPVNTVRAALLASYADVVTPGIIDTGTIRSSTATLTRGLGYADNGTAVTVKPALFGDADLDGGVSINDFNALSGSFGASSGKVWTDGDFDYDGGVSINDFNLLAGSFGQSLPPTSEAWSGLLAFAAAHNDLVAFEAVTGVPEPTTFGLIAAGATLGLRRRRRTA